MKKSLAAVLTLAALAVPTADAAEPRPEFTRKPTARRINGKVRIEFAVNRKTDVTVFVLGAGGRVVRHLASGVLGKTPPKPLKPGLVQSIDWDRRDDLGKPCSESGGAYKVRVGLGLGLKPDKVVTSRGGLSAIRGLAVGPRGELYALGMVGNLHSGDASPACLVYDRSGKYLRTIMPYSAELPAAKVERPGVVAVHHKSGAIYALSGPKSCKLVKISGLGGKVAASLNLPLYGGIQHAHYRPVMALDAEAQPPVVWIGGANGFSRYRIMRCEDAGGKFAGGRDVCPPALTSTDLSLDRERDALCLRPGAPNLGSAVWIDGASGKRTRVRVRYARGSTSGGSLLVCGRDGFMYLKTAGQREKGGIYRFSREMKPMPFENGRAFVSVPGEATKFDSLHLLARGLDVNARGHGAVHIEYRGPRNRNSGRHWGKVLTFEGSGKVLSHSLVDGLTAGACSPRIDAAGNIYVADCCKPAGRVLPPGLDGRVPRSRKLPTGAPNWYPAMCGSIIKFPPSGGKLRGGGSKVTVGYGGKHDLTLSGALWQRDGVSGTPLHKGVGGAYYCSCEQMRFDVDGFGRVFAPDVVRYQIAVMDSAGSPIGRFGTYGNIDAQSRGGAALRFAWPLHVAAGDRAVYVGDPLNRSVLRAELTYAREGTCEVR
jgi:hypothetical protein